MSVESELIADYKKKLEKINGVIKRSVAKKRVAKNKLKLKLASQYIKELNLKV